MSDLPDPILDATCELFLRSLDKTSVGPDLQAGGTTVTFPDAAVSLKQAITIFLTQGGAIQDFGFADHVATNYPGELALPASSSPGLGFQAMADALAQGS